MQVSEETIQWLEQLGIITFYDAQQTADDRYEFIKQVQQNFENGLKFAKIAKAMSFQQAKVQKAPEQPLPQLDGLKELFSPSAKIYNWNILVQVFKKFNVTVDADVKSLIIAGDLEMMQELLTELMRVYKSWGPSQENANKFGYSQNGKKQGNNYQNKRSNQNSSEYQEVIDLTKLDITKDVSRSKSCLEFFILILSKHLELDPKQTASLFTHGSKYLAHVLVKGVKGLFDPIIAFYTEVYSNINTLVRLFNEDSSHKSLHFSLGALKPGLVSKSFEVAEWAARLFSKLAFEFGDNILLMHAWEWFVGAEGQGLNMTLLGLKRHPDLKSLIVSTLLQFARFNFVELFTTHLKKALQDPKDLLGCYTQLLPSLMESKSSREEIISNGILDDWVDTGFEALTDEFKGNDLKISALNYLVMVWTIYPSKIEDQEIKANNLINYLAKSVREKNQSIQYTSLVLQFKLLLQFGLEKNPYAPIIYKTLTLSLIENSGNSSMREFLLNNFITIFETLGNIPMNILLEPFVRQIQVMDQNQFVYNIFDFNFFTYIAKNDRLQLKNAIQILDLLAKVFLNNIVYAQICVLPIMTIIQKNIEIETMQEFVIKFVKIALAMFFASEKKKRPKEKMLPLYNNKSAAQQTQINPQDLDNEILNAQKRSLIVQIIKNIVQVGNFEINEKIKPLVAHTNMQIKNFRHADNKGMMAILDSFGDSHQILKKYEEEFKEHQKLLKQEEKETMEKEQEQLVQSIDQYNFNQNDETKNETIMLIEKNLSKYGIPRQHAQMTKDEVTRLALLRNPKASKKTLNELQQIKENFANRQELKQKIDEKNQSIIEVRNKNNRTTLARRAMEYGISNYNQIDQNTVMLYDLGKREQQLIREGKIGIPQIVFIDLRQEEQRDQEMTGILLKKYHKALRYLFLKYANSGFNIKERHSKQKTFDEIQQNSSLISTPECWKMIQEQGLNKHKGQETVFIKQDQYYKELTINRERIKKSKLIPEKKMYEVLVEREYEMVTTQENQQLIQVTNQYMNKILTEKQGGVEQKQEKNSKLYQHSNEDAKGASTSQRGNLKDLAKSHQNLKKTENQNLSYDGFEQYVIQLALHLNSKFPSDLRHLPLSSSIQYMFDRIRDSFKERNLNTTIFDNPEGQFFGDKEVIEKFNETLAKDPNYPLPEAYYKKKEKEVSFSYKIPQIPGVSESWKDCYEIMNDILNKVGVQTVEPKSESKMVWRCYPKYNDGIKAKAQFYDVHQKPQLPYYMQNKPKTTQSGTPDLGKILKTSDGSYVKHMKSRGAMSQENLFRILPGSTFNSHLKKYGSKKNLQINSQHKLPLSMKLQISQIGYKDRWTAEQVGFVLDDMVRCIEDQNVKFVGDGLFRPDNQVKLFKEMQKQKQLEQYEQKMKKAQRLKKSNVEIDHNGRQIITEQQRKEFEEVKAKREEEEKKKKEEEEQKKQQQLKKEEEKKKNRENWLQQQKEKALLAIQEKQRKEKEEKEANERRLMEMKQKKIEEFKEFNQSKIEKYKENFSQIQNQRKQQEEEQRIQKRQLKVKKEKLYKKIITDDKKRKEFEQETEENLRKLAENPEFQEIFKKYGQQIENLFNLLLKFNTRKLEQLDFADEINLKTFNWFCFHFGLYPEIIHYLDSVLIFRSCTVQKQDESLRSKGINFELFKQALIRLACKGKQIFNQFAQNIGKEGDELNQTNMNNLVNNNQINIDQSQINNQSSVMENNNPENKELENKNYMEKYVKLVDDYGNISECNPQTLESLILYLALPADKQGMDERFRQILEEGYKPDLRQKAILSQKLKQDPLNFSRNNISMYQKNPNKSILGEINETFEGDQQEKDTENQDNIIKENTQESKQQVEQN